MNYIYLSICMYIDRYFVVESRVGSHFYTVGPATVLLHDMDIYIHLSYFQYKNEQLHVEHETRRDETRRDETRRD